MNNYTEITAIDWAILDALIDYESVNLIHELVTSETTFAPTRKDILNRVEKLFQNQFIFLTNNQTFDRPSLEAEIEDRTTEQLYWFGRTEKGDKAWEELTEKYYENTEQTFPADRE